MLLAQHRGITQRRQIGRAVGDMDAIEQSMPVQFAIPARRNSASAAGDTNTHGAVAAVTRDDIAHVARQEPIAVFFGVEQPETRSRQRLGAERETGGVEPGRDDAERGERGRRFGLGGGRNAGAEHDQ